ESRGISMIKISPSILAADFAHLSAEISDVEKGGADYIHVYFMDGHLVPNITFVPSVVEAIRPVTTIPLNLHLMIDLPADYIPMFANAGASILTVHQEASVHLHRTIQMIKHYGVKAGVAINPATPLMMVKEVLHDVDLVLIMTVNPGFGDRKSVVE